MSQVEKPPRHPDFAVLVESWDLAMDADGYSVSSRRSYRRAVNSLADWLAVNRPGVGPVDFTRDHVRGWLVHVRDNTSRSTARTGFPGVRHFCRWMVAERETDTDATDGIKTPAPNDQQTPILSLDEIRALLDTCTGSDFVARRDRAILYAFTDCGLRLAEVAGLRLDNVDVRQRMLIVRGKGSNRSGPRLRAVPFGVKAAQAFDRYLRERRKHPYAETAPLWLGGRNRANLSIDGVKRMVYRRAEQAGLIVHPHMLRHSWAHAFRAAGGSEGDLMVLGGWSNRSMLDRYGKSGAVDRAHEAYRKLSLGDRL